MYAQLLRMLYPEEKALFPVYCIFRQGGFTSYYDVGYLAATDKGRLLFVRYDIIDGTLGSCPFTAIKQLKIKKLIIGQYKFEFRLMTEKKDFSITAQVAPKVVGGTFPNQSENLNMLMSTLQPYVTK